MAGLFAAAEQVLLDDASGRIDYVPSLLDAGFAQAAFVALRDGARWKSERRQMYAREVDVPRLLGSYKLADAALPPVIATIHEAVRARVDAPFDSVGLNLYRDERDSVAPHNDHLYDIRKGFPIALLSLGATRRMIIRTKKAPRRSLNVDLEAGSLLVMDYATQIHYDHGVPKTKEPVGERISLAFRVKGGAGRY